MCGISGILKIKNKNLNLKQEIKEMIKVLEHRGPNAEGFYINDSIALGHRRLSIIDLSSKGNQPMSNEDGSIWIVHNGEIYNYPEIREELIKKGHTFKSHTDTEVIIHAYEEYGEECLKLFNGMWAFAIWDDKNKKLFASRDRMGEKPFYYYFSQKDDIFIFASEIKSILKTSFYIPKPNEEMVKKFLAHGTSYHPYLTFFEEIFQIPPSHFLIIQNGKIKINKYWDINPQKKIFLKNDEEYAKEFLNLFKDAIKIRLRADVKIGSCLSGGLDSSSIVCMVNSLLKEKKIKNIGAVQQTFTSAFEDKRFDERDFVEEVRKKTKVKTHFTFPDPQKIVEELEKVIWHQEEPFPTMSMIAQWEVMKLAKKNNIIVLLDGQGGDELLGGYIPYLFVYLQSLFYSKQFFKFLKELILIKKNYNLSSKIIIQKILHQIFKKIPENIKGKIKQFLKIKTPKDILKFPAPKFNFDKNSKFKDLFKKYMYINLYYESLPALLRYEDKNSMAFSRETRLPFLDYRIIEFLFAVPSEQQIKNGKTKYILRNAMEGLLPEKVRNRMDKMGFETPQEIWLKEDLKNFVNNFFESNNLYAEKFVDIKKLKEYYENFCNNKLKDFDKILWRVLILELWHKKFFQKEKK